MRPAHRRRDQRRWEVSVRRMTGFRSGERHEREDQRSLKNAFEALVGQRLGSPDRRDDRAPSCFVIRAVGFDLDVFDHTSRSLRDAHFACGLRKVGRRQPVRTNGGLDGLGVPRAKSLRHAIACAIGRSTGALAKHRRDREGRADQYTSDDLFSIQVALLANLRVNVGARMRHRHSRRQRSQPSGVKTAPDGRALPRLHRHVSLLAHDLGQLRHFLVERGIATVGAQDT